jgi:hypothetical protein
MASLGRPKFRTEFEKQVIITNLEKRGITRAKEDEDWHFFWASVGTVRSMCAPVIACVSRCFKRVRSLMIMTHTLILILVLFST